MKEVTITEDQLKNMLGKIKELEDYVKLPKAEVAWAERGYTKNDTKAGVLHKEWVGLTDQEIWDISVDNQRKGGGFWGYPRALEAKLKEKNT